jgi:hypothetical protein
MQVLIGLLPLMWMYYDLWKGSDMRVEHDETDELDDETISDARSWCLSKDVFLPCI